MRYQIEGKLLARHEYSISRFSPFARAICRLYPAARGQAHVSVPPRWRRRWSPGRRITATTFPLRVFPRVSSSPCSLKLDPLRYPRRVLPFREFNKSIREKFRKFREIWLNRKDEEEEKRICPNEEKRKDIYKYTEEGKDTDRIQPLPIPTPPPIVC